MTAFTALGVELHLMSAIALIPVAAIGHIIGLKTHDAILQNDQTFKRWVGVGMMLVSLLGLWKLYS